MGTTIFVESGRVSTGLVLGDEIYMRVFSGGTAIMTTVNNRGGINNNGVANDTTVNSGGYLTVYSGASASKTTINGYASMTISSGGVATKTNVRGNSNYAGLVHVRDGAVANETTVDSRGRLNISGAGMANETVVLNGGTMFVSSGGTANVTAIQDGGVMMVANYGSASGVTIASGGVAHISAGAHASAVQLNAGGFLGGIGFLEDHYWEEIVDGSAVVAENFWIVGCSAVVRSGGAASDVIVHSSGFMHISGGTVQDSVVSDRGFMYVFSGGAAKDTNISGSFASMTVSGGGTASDTTVHASGAIVLAGGSADNTTVNGSGSMVVLRGEANNTTVSNGGLMTVSSGGRALAVQLNAGGCLGGIAFAEDRYWAEIVNGIASVSDQVWIIGNSAIVASGGAVDSSITVERYGRMYIFSGGTANGNTINQGALLYVSSGGTAEAIVENGGYVAVLDGAEVTFASHTLTGELTALATVHTNTVASALRVRDTIGQLQVFSGGVARDTIVTDWGYMRVFESGTAQNTFVDDCGALLIESGGTAREVTIGSSGFLCISGGGVADDLNIGEWGHMIISSGGTAMGRMEIAGGTINIKVESGAIIDFTAAGQAAGGAALINDWSRLAGAADADYTLTVAVDQASGEYALAAGAADFNKTVTVKTAETTLGSLAVGGTLVCGDVSYTLNKTDDLLSLTVVGPEPPAVAEVVLTITDPNHGSYGAAGGWKVRADQTVAWQDLTTLGTGYSYLGLGTTAANKAMPDIYVYNAEAKYVAAYITDETGAITGFESIFTGEAALTQVGLADFTGDGVSDLLLRTADGFVGYYANNTFNEVQGLGLEWQVAALGDVDGNGRADIVIAHEAGYVGAYLIGADGSISWADLGNLDSSTQIVGTGDVNGDGTGDVIIQVGANYYGAWLCGNGSVTGFFGIGTFDAEVQDIADYNGDGTDDLLLRTAGGIVGAALINGADAVTWAEYGGLGDEWSTKGVGIL